MTKADKKKIIAINAALWAGAMLVSFILPLVAESMTEGRGKFLIAMMHVFPLIAAMWISCNLLDRAIGEPTE